MKIICNYCKEIFDILDKEYKRQIKKGRIITEFYCSRYCSSKGNGIKRFGEIVIKIEEVKCNKCNNKIEIKYREGKKKDKYFCSRSCANSRNWSEEDKLKKSLSAKNSEKVLKVNKSIEKRKLLSESAKRQYKEGRMRFEQLHTKEIQDKVRNVHKKRSIKWMNSLNRETKQDYRKLCRFRFNLKDYPELFDFELLKKYGMYHPVKNPNGVSRDHKFSVSEGYKQKIDPYYISHPINCELVLWNENHSKYTKCSTTFEELKERIDKQKGVK